jgi:hypothetical protein
MRPVKEAFETAKTVAASVNPAVADVDVTKAFTTQFLDKLRDMGFNDAIGAPKQD